MERPGHQQHCAWIIVASVAAACAGGASEGTRGNPNANPFPRAGQGSAGSAGSGTGSFGNSPGTAGSRPPVVMPMGGRASVDPNACQSTGKRAEAGLASADIVWVIDGSGSMIDEAERVQNNIDSFVSGITSAGVDTHVVMLAENNLVPAGSTLAQSGKYLYVDDEVDSTNALERIVARFDDYKSFLRPDAHVNFIVVTDDEARFMNLGTPQQRAEAFQTAMAGRLASFSLHAIASPGNPGDLPCAPESVPAEIVQCCRDYIFTLFTMVPAGCEQHMQVNPLDCAFIGGAAAPGTTYFELARATNGVGSSICAEDWTMVFGSLRDAVIESAPLPCNYAIPEPPAGMSFQRGLVNVKYTPSGADPTTVTPYPGVANETACGDKLAWYYDNPDAPTEVLLCPSACQAVGAATGGSVDVLFGCKTILVE